MNEIAHEKFGIVIYIARWAENVNGNDVIATYQFKAGKVAELEFI